MLVSNKIRSPEERTIPYGQHSPTLASARPVCSLSSSFLKHLEMNYLPTGVSLLFYFSRNSIRGSCLWIQPAGILFLADIHPD